MEKTQITIKDIARELNISPSTVSRALKNHPDISAETRKLVNEFAKEHNYIPNTVALTLRMGNPKIIGVVIPQLVHHFFSLVLAGIEDVANEKGYSVLISQSNENYEKEIQCIHALHSSRVSGILASISKDSLSYNHFNMLLEQKVPLVFFDRICTGLTTSKVVVDDYAGALAATEYLIKTGCKRIAFFSAPFNLEISKNRRNGYKDALLKHGIPFDSSLICVCDNREWAIEVTPRILSMDNPPDAIFCINDHTASGVMYAAKRMGLRIPNDLSICGFSDGLVAQASDPQLTSVEQHGYELGQSAAELLIEQIQEISLGKTPSPKNKVIKTNLIVRESTKKV